MTSPASPIDPLYRPPARTVIAPEVLLVGLARVSPDLPWTSLLVLLSQWSVETGGGRACWNWNLGNKKRIPGRPFTMLRNTWEILRSPVTGPHVTSSIDQGDGTWRVTFQPPHPQTHFQAFDSAEAGIFAYVDGMRRRFARAWVTLADGPEAFAHALKTLRYYTAPADAYARSMRVAFDRFAISMPALAGLPLLGYVDARAFQSAHPPLVVDGIVGPLTRAAIVRAFDASR